MIVSIKLCHIHTGSNNKKQVSPMGKSTTQFTTLCAMSRQKCSIKYCKTKTQRTHCGKNDLLKEANKKYRQRRKRKKKEGTNITQLPLNTVNQTTIG